MAKKVTFEFQRLKKEPVRATSVERTSLEEGMIEERPRVGQVCAGGQWGW